MLSEPVDEPQWPAVSTHWGAISVPLQPNEPMMRTFATYLNCPSGTGLPPTTAWAGAATSNAPSSPAKKTLTY